jgi:hypothetical protein
MQQAFTESIVEQAALNWLSGLGRQRLALRNGQLPKLISGELRMPDAERIVGRAM